MKTYAFIFSTFLLCILLMTCKKAAQPVTLVHKWNVLSDSTDNLFSGNRRYYTGQTGDYFDFRTDNKIYLKEGSLLDTMSYSINADGTAEIYYKYFPSSLTGQATDTKVQLSANNATLLSNSGLTPEGAYGRGVRLSRLVGF